jgi:hypothetical protein
MLLKFCGWMLLVAGVLTTAFAPSIVDAAHSLMPKTEIKGGRRAQALGKAELKATTYVATCNGGVEKRVTYTPLAATCNAKADRGACSASKATCN